MDLDYGYLTKASEQAAEDLSALVQQISRQPRAIDRQYLQRLVDSPSVLIVARDGDRIVGCAEVVIGILPSKVKGWLEDVVVDEHYRGRGIAKKLVSMAIDYAREAGCRHLNLTSGDDRGLAHGVYEAQGFKRRAAGVYRLELEP
ncbi:MAG TPA: GNAT family N-acetyltransferase [Candidatus Saccharimonadia bacterium]|jgi:phosphinothricin acetyltransferase